MAKVLSEAPFAIVRRLDWLTDKCLLRWCVGAPHASPLQVFGKLYRRVLAGLCSSSAQFAGLSAMYRRTALSSVSSRMTRS